MACTMSVMRLVLQRSFPQEAPAPEDCHGLVDQAADLGVGAVAPPLASLEPAASERDS